MLLPRSRANVEVDARRGIATVTMHRSLMPDSSNVSLRAHIMTAYTADEMLVSSMLATQGGHCGTVVGPVHNRFNKD